MRYALALLLLSACATAPAVVAPPPRWPAALTYSVVAKCGRAQLGTLTQCGCFAETLERLSPGDEPATREQVEAAMAACGIEPEPEPEDTEGSI